MEENKFLRFCPKHGNQGEAALTCPECGQETVLSDVTRDEYGEWLFSSDDREKLYPYSIQKAFYICSQINVIYHDKTNINSILV